MSGVRLQIAEPGRSVMRSFGTLRRPLLQRKCACGTQTLEGQCAECQQKRMNGSLQTKLAISKPSDASELEAERVAEQVMRMPDPELDSNLNRTTSESLIQRRAGGEAGGIVDAPLSVHAILNSPGQPLDSAARAFFEPRFGHDFSKVRVHVGQFAARSAEDVAAQAYTVGHRVVFGPGCYAPVARDGYRLLAHELTHVVQQGVSPQSPTIVQRMPLYTGTESDVVAEREYGDSGAPKAHACGRPSWSPPGFVILTEVRSWQNIIVPRMQGG
jgi:hypothetical protein